MELAVAEPAPSNGGQLSTLPTAGQCSPTLADTPPPMRFSSILDWQQLQARLRWVSVGTQTDDDWVDLLAPEVPPVAGEQDPDDAAHTLLQESLAASGPDFRAESTRAESGEEGSARADETLEPVAGAEGDIAAEDYNEPELINNEAEASMESDVELPPQELESVRAESIAVVLPNRRIVCDLCQEQLARDEKIRYYWHLTAEISELTGATRVHFFGFVTGARGKWPEFNKEIPSQLGLAKYRYRAKAFAKLVPIYAALPKNGTEPDGRATQVLCTKPDVTLPPGRFPRVGTLWSTRFLPLMAPTQGSEPTTTGGLAGREAHRKVSKEEQSDGKWAQRTTTTTKGPGSTQGERRPRPRAPLQGSGAQAEVLNHHHHRGAWVPPVRASDWYLTTTTERGSSLGEPLP
ncbi:reverse transcriptase [Arapaima gigas]